METTTTTDNLALYLNTTRPISNWTFDDLKKLNDAKAKALLPAMLVIGLYMVLGIVGNSLVCYVMGFKLKMNTQNMLIIYLAVFDLLNCLVCMPADIHDMQHYFYFPSEIGCKIVRMAMSFTSEASILTLVVVAVDRFRKICKPLKTQMHTRHTKWFLVLVLFIATLLSWPALVIFGFRTIDTGIPGIPGHDCSISDSLKGTLYPMIYTSALFLLLIVFCVCLIVLYSCVLVAARGHRRYMSTNSNPNHFTYPSIRGMKYAKNNDSTSATMTITEETTGLRQSHESLHNVGISNVNSSGAHPLTQCHPHSKPRGYNMGRDEELATKKCGELEMSEIVDEDKKFMQMKNIVDTDDRDNKEMNQNTTATNGDFCQLDNSLHQRLDQIKKADGDSTSNKILSSDSSQSHFINSEKTKTNAQFFNKQPKSMKTTKFGSSKSFSQNIENSIVGGNAGVRNSDTKDDEIRKRRIRSSLKMSKLDHKTTIIAFLVTIVFILSYVPYLSLQISKQIVEGLDYDLQGAALVFYNIFLRSYYINSVSNPIIYGLMNNRFRRQLRILLSKPFRTCQKGHE